MTTFAAPNFVEDVKFSDASTNPSISNGGTPPSAATVLLDYEAAAWLAQQIMADHAGITPSNTPSLDQQIGDLSFALLAIFSSSAESSAGFTAEAETFYYEALNPTTPYASSQFSDVELWTPNPLNASQEYITIDAMDTTPEPSSLVLFGTGLLCILLASGRKLAAKILKSGS